MTHLDEELMAQWALEDTAPDPAAAEHLSSCAHCQEVLADLRTLTTNLHGAPELDTPSTHVWDRITTELNLTTGTGGEGGSGQTTAVGETAETRVVDAGARDAGTTGTRVVDAGAREAGAGVGEDGAPGAGTAETGGGRKYGRGMLALAAGVAVVLGIGIGLGAAAVLDQDEPTSPPVAEVQLEPLPGKSGGGTADLIQAGDELQVAVSGLDATSGYYEVWLINADGERMVSLGVLDPAQGGTFRIPDNLTGEGYRIVDISLEPNDGNPAHSRDSIVRGTLPS